MAAGFPKFDDRKVATADSGDSASSEPGGAATSESGGAATSEPGGSATSESGVQQLLSLAWDRQESALSELAAKQPRKMQQMRRMKPPTYPTSAISILFLK